MKSKTAFPFAVDYFFSFIKSPLSLEVSAAPIQTDYLSLCERTPPASPVFDPAL